MCIYRIIFIILLSISSKTFGQDDKFLFICNSKIDTLPYIKENIERNKFYDVPELNSMKDEYVFRSWGMNNCIEIIKNGDELSGKVHFAVEGFNKKRFTKSYKLSKKVTQRLFLWVNRYQYNRRESNIKVVAIVHTFEIKVNSNVEIYTADSSLLNDEIWEIMSIETYLDKFDKDIPFKKYTYWELILYAYGEPYYFTKRNE